MDAVKQTYHFVQSYPHTDRTVLIRLLIVPLIIVILTLFAIRDIIGFGAVLFMPEIILGIMIQKTVSFGKATMAQKTAAQLSQSILRKKYIMVVFQVVLFLAVSVYYLYERFRHGIVRP